VTETVGLEEGRGVAFVMAPVAGRDRGPNIPIAGAADRIAAEPI
jgi:hypothetical protein